MRYEYRKIGPRPEAGHPLYIALHGGGSAPTAVNDRAWNHMKIYYLSSVTNGVYVAPRGVADTWNLHSVAASYPLYDRLIENMILFEGVDPNRVYLLGYSAGGDGVYQVSPRMADRFAAANMSAGHHNNVNPSNLCNLPFLMQVGENDKAYGRNRATVHYNMRMDDLQQQHGEDRENLLDARETAELPQPVPVEDRRANDCLQEVVGQRHLSHTGKRPREPLQRACFAGQRHGGYVAGAHQDASPVVVLAAQEERILEAPIRLEVAVHAGHNQRDSGQARRQQQCCVERSRSLAAEHSESV
jgi:predicted esterase